MGEIMKRLKFRVYDNDNKMFEYIDFNSLEDVEEVIDNYHNYFWSDYFKDHPECFQYPTCHQDINGKDIYEGDVVRVTADHNLVKKDEIYIIEYSEDYCQIVATNQTTKTCVDLMDLYKPEIIGNTLTSQVG
jgi:uncharacterized phage protein (TIGR01671 family)